MPDDRAAISPPKTNGHYSLRDIFVTLTALAIVLGVFVQIPRDTLQYAIRTAPQLITFSALLSTLPLACINLIVLLILRLTPRNGSESSPPTALRWWRPDRLLWQAASAEPQTWRVAVTIAIISTFTIAAFWPLLRELGLAVSVHLSQNYGRARTLYVGIPKLMVDSAYLARTSKWELWALSRWWLLFGSLTAVWLLASRMLALLPLRSPWNIEPTATTLRRLLAFAPWLVVLEIAFLVGVWVDSPSTVPEPSTGFVEGIFGWHLWHWHGWKSREWVTRGLVPTWFIASLFAHYVLRWRWPFAIAAAACLVPIALTLSVAWSVLWSYTLP